jgi:hypothetical protein
MLKNLDGTPYQLTGSIEQFNPQDPAITQASEKMYDLFNFWDQQAIIQGGTPIYYYEMLIQPQTVHPIYLEDRGKLFSMNPITLYATYDPIPSQNFQNQFGIDSPDEIKLELNYRAVKDAIGHPPKLGSRIHTPHLNEDWQIIQRNTGEYLMWGVMRIILICKRFQESTTTSEGTVTQKNEPDYRINIV